MMETDTKKQPVYVLIYHTLLREIKDGLYSDKGMVPSEHTLSTRFGVERSTVRKALKLLVDDGLVKKVPGMGTKLIDPSEIQPPPIQKSAPAPREQPRKVILLASLENYLETSNGEHFHLRLIHGFEKKISEMGCSLMIKSISGEKDFDLILRQTNPAAVIFDSYVPENIYPAVLNAGILSVSVNHYTPLMTSVISNNFDGAYSVTKMLMEDGHKRIAFITGKHNYQTNIERLSGVQRMYLKIGENLQDKYIYQGNYLFDSGYAAGEQFLAMSEEERPTAVFAFNDDMAFGCYSCFERHNISVPGDISIVGFDRSDRFNSAFGSITTVDVNIDAMIDYTCWYLSGRLSGTAPETCAKIQIDTSILDCGTTRKL